MRLAIALTIYGVALGQPSQPVNPTRQAVDQTGGLARTSITAKGFGKTRAVACNDTAVGRQQDRRVELVVSGEILGNALK